MMSSRPLALIVILLLGVSAPVVAEQRGEAKKQVEFGITVAQKGLWREAIYRWIRATELDPTYAQAFNNLAVAYERAIALEPNNLLIQQNFDLFKEINDRTAPGGGR